MDVLGCDRSRPPLRALRLRGVGLPGCRCVVHGIPRCRALYDGCRTVALVRRSSYNWLCKAMPTQTTTEIPHPTRAELELGAVLHALSDPVRLKIVAALARAEDGPPQTCGSFDVPVSKSTCTHHFKVLREAGVIRQEPEGTTRLNTPAARRPRRAVPGPARDDPAVRPGLGGSRTVGRSLDLSAVEMHTGGRQQIGDGGTR